MNTIVLPILATVLFGPANPTASPGYAQPASRDRDTTVSSAPDSGLSPAPILERTRFGLAGAPPASVTFELRYPADLSRFLLEDRDPVNKLDLVFQGLGQGASAVGFLGSVGNALGFWDEATAWKMIAAGAAAGAIWSGLTAEPSP